MLVTGKCSGLVSSVVLVWNQKENIELPSSDNGAINSKMSFPVIFRVTFYMAVKGATACIIFFKIDNNCRFYFNVTKSIAFTSLLPSLGHFNSPAIDLLQKSMLFYDGAFSVADQGVVCIFPRKVGLVSRALCMGVDTYCFMNPGGLASTQIMV